VKAAGIPLLFAAACVGGIVHAPHVQAQPLYAALAFSGPDGRSGKGWNRFTAEEAGNDAIGMCQSRGGSACKVVLNLPSVCAALAVGYNWYQPGYQGYNPDEYAYARPEVLAEEYALDRCRQSTTPDSCRIVELVCAGASTDLPPGARGGG
jgi:hypothetical protein